MSKTQKIGECSRCHINKELVRSKWCKECKNAYEKERRSKNSEEKKKQILELEKERYQKQKEIAKEKLESVDQNSEKTCTICNKVKQVKDFYQSKNKGHMRAMCKDCSSEDRKKYYKENKNEVIKQTNNYKVEKMKKDPIFKLERRLRTRIYQAFVAQDSKKSDRTWKYIGCSPKQFQEWMEYQLYDGMTLENYGNYWHIDHVKPCSSFDLSKEDHIEKCFSWKNLRPYKAEKNLEKNDKIILEDIVLQELKVKCFIKKLNNGSEKHPADEAILRKTVEA